MKLIEPIYNPLQSKFPLDAVIMSHSKIRQSPRALVQQVVDAAAYAAEERVFRDNS